MDTEKHRGRVRRELLRGNSSVLLSVLRGEMYSGHSIYGCMDLPRSQFWGRVLHRSEMASRRGPYFFSVPSADDRTDTDRWDARN